MKRKLQRLQIRIMAWRLKSRQSSLDRIVAARPISKLDAYIDPSLMAPGTMTRAQWIKKVAEAEARRNAAIGQFGQDPLGLSEKILNLD